MMDIVGKIDRVLNEKNGDKKYREFFNKKLKEWKIKSPAELSKKERKKFFNEIELEWTGEKGD